MGITEWGTHMFLSPHHMVSMNDIVPHISIEHESRDIRMIRHPARFCQLVLAIGTILIDNIT
jgi:hypothetical protein